MMVASTRVTEVEGVRVGQISGYIMKLVPTGFPNCKCGV